MKCTIILSAIFTVLQLFANHSYAQVPDNIDGKLWRLAKVWGFAKYYHPDNCNVNWNELLLTAIDSVLVSTSNESFNLILSDLLEAAGPVPTATQPLVISGDINLNAHFEWIDDPYFSSGVRDQLDDIQINFRPRPSCLLNINDFTNPQYNSWIDFRMDELNVPSFTYTNELHRMLIYFYYWNTIDYFHADKDLMDQPWDTTLLQFIPIFREAETETDFHVRLLNLATYLDDSHGFTSSPLISSYFGTYYPLIKLDFIENQTVVTALTAESSDIAIGDIVKKINGIDIAVLRDSLSDYSPASNDARRMLDVHRKMLRGQNNAFISLELEDASGESYTTTVTKKYTASEYYNWTEASSNPPFSIIDCGYGYVDMAKLTVGQIPLMYALFKNTPAIVFDVRNYPLGTLWNLIPLFYESPMAWALLTDPDITFPGWYFWTSNQYHAGVFNNPEAYNGKVIILANAETQSQAEYTVMGLQQHPNAFTIGSQTSGADGNISYLDLPGSLRTYWTSLGIFYPDSTTAQRVGVRIDSVVMPTIEDIRQGRDAELLAALECLTSLDQDYSYSSTISVFPNPADQIIYLNSEKQLPGPLAVNIFNSLGQRVFNETIFERNMDPIPLNVSILQNGMYIIIIAQEQGLTESIKIHIQH